MIQRENIGRDTPSMRRASDAPVLRQARSTSVALGFLFAIACVGHLGAQEYLEVIRVTETQLIIRSVSFKVPQIVDLSDLNVWPAIITGKDPFKVYHHPTVDLKLQLLEKGWASLKSPNTTASVYRDAEVRARGRAIGLWAPAAGQPNASRQADVDQSDPPIDWDSVLTRLWQGLGVLFSAGILAVIARALHSRFVLQKRVSLVLVGEVASGKSALFERLLSPSATEKQIKEMTMTEVVQNRKYPSFIPKGRYEIYPEGRDVPGKRPGAAWDAFAKRRVSAMMVVLAPVEVLSGPPSADYVLLQLGCVKWLCSGVLGARHTRKPRVVIVFINKFDVLSNVAPGDSAASAATETMRVLFAKHIAEIQFAGKQAGIPVHVFIGSALKNWNCDRLVDTVCRELYGI